MRLSLRGAYGRAAGLTLALIVLAACASSPATPVNLPPEGQRQDDAAASDSPSRLSGWDSEDHLGAFIAYAESCSVMRDPAGRAQCLRALQLRQTLRPVTPTMARYFFETGFQIVQARTADGTPGLLTSYFAPEYEASRVRNAVFDAPVLGRPADLRRPYLDRVAIEAAAATGQGDILGWMRAEDLFFMQVQGSGYLTFADGSKVRAAYAADNGQPFVGIARPMRERGLLADNNTSSESIRSWLAARRGPQAQEIMALNPRYIFFDVQPDDSGDPSGAAGIPLTARRSIAVDPGNWTYGDLVWIDADGGDLIGARASYRGLVVALDTGSAIRGPVRADFYMGRGQAAGSEAGTVRHPLRMWRLVPRPN